MFTLSKLLSALTQPLTWIVLLLACGWWQSGRRPARGHALVGAGLALLLVLGWVPLPDLLLLRPLERQSPPPAPPSDSRWADYAGVVVLGGALEHAAVREGNGQVALNAAAERMTLAAALARAHPGLRIVFTGGDGTLLRQPESEARQARQFFDELGLPPGRLQVESDSRTTYENAVFTARLPGVDPSRPWLLVTSGWHMPRALATFRAAGWNVAPYAVDYRAGDRTPWSDYALVRSLLHWQIGLHETLGLWAYRWSDRAR
jgi:uncharacterized SAM-binding protein YcdF (DUF218 family)